MRPWDRRNLQAISQDFFIITIWKTYGCFTVTTNNWKLPKTKIVCSSHWPLSLSLFVWDVQTNRKHGNRMCNQQSRTGPLFIRDISHGVSENHNQHSVCVCVTISILRTWHTLKAAMPLGSSGWIGKLSNGKVSSSLKTQVKVFEFECEVTKSFLWFVRGPVFSISFGFQMIGCRLSLRVRTIFGTQSISFTGNTFTETPRKHIWPNARGPHGLDTLLHKINHCVTTRRWHTRL